LNYNQILLEYSDEITNIPQLDAKLDYYCKDPSMFLKFFKTVLSAIGIGVAGTGFYKTVAPEFKSIHNIDPTFGLKHHFVGSTDTNIVTTTRQTPDRIYSGLKGIIAGSLIGYMGYRLLDHMIKKRSNKILNSEDLTKEEKLKIINGMIEQTRDLKSKSDDEDAEHCTRALKKLEDLKQQIIKTKMV